MFRSIRSVLGFSLVLLSVLVMIVTMTIAYLIIDAIRNRFAGDYSAMYAASVQRDIAGTLDDYIRMSRVMAGMPAVREWLANDTAPHLRRAAFASISTIQSNLKDRPGVFAGAAASLNYYFNNEYKVRMRTDVKDDAWFFRMRDKKEYFILDIDYDTQTHVTRFWLNVAVLEGARFLGVVGCGMDISRYIATLLASRQEGSLTILISPDGTIKGHPDESLIKKKRIQDLVPARYHARLAATLQRTQGENTGQLPLVYAGRRYIASLGRIESIGWYALVLVDPAVIISFGRFIPIFLIQLAGFLIAFFFTWLVTNHVVVTPLLGLSRSMDEIGATDLKRRVRLAARYELAHLTETFNQMLDRMEKQQGQLIERERLEKEFELVREMQASILPSIPEQKGYELSARMIPAEEVGGDYYDFYRTPEGNIWYGIGDVTGHGITSGIIMLMAQTAVNTILQIMPEVSPNELAVYVNRALYENIHNRLHSRSYMTFYFLETCEDGIFRYSGSHCDLLIYRKATGKCERIAPDGTWLGIFADISKEIVQREFRLEDGDILILYTDGIIEAMDSAREQFGIQRLSQIVEKNATLPVEEIRRKIFDAVREHMQDQDDDLTLFLIRRAV